METAIVADDAGSEIRIIVLDSDEKAFTALTKVANDAGITAVSVTAIGAFKNATVGGFDFDEKSCRKIEIAEQCEVFRAIGGIAVGDDGAGRAKIETAPAADDVRARMGTQVIGEVDVARLIENAR